MYYVVKVWALKTIEGRTLERKELRILRWIMGISLRDYLRNEEVHERAGEVRR